MLEQGTALKTYDERLAWYNSLSDTEKQELEQEVTKSLNRISETFKSAMDELQKSLSYAINEFVELYQVYGYPLPESRESKK